MEMFDKVDMVRQEKLERTKLRMSKSTEWESVDWIVRKS